MSADASAPTLTLTFVGHSTVLLEMDGRRVLTDPLLRRRAGPLIRKGPAPPVGVYRDLDAVVISHAHIDHLDVPSLRLVAKTTPVLAPPATERLLRRLGFVDVTEMEAGQSRDLAGVSVDGHAGSARRYASSVRDGGRPARIHRAGESLGVLRRRHGSVRRDGGIWPSAWTSPCCPSAAGARACPTTT